MIGLYQIIYIEQITLGFGVEVGLISYLVVDLTNTPSISSIYKN